ncbi:MAG: GNAT family N-acetyltransferase [Rickettsiales bacterium]
MSETGVELLTELNSLDLMDICDATESTMLDTYGFSVGFKQWAPPLRSDLEAYFNGVMLIPERKLFVARVDGTIGGSLQLMIPHDTNQTSNFSVSLDNHFVAPWARNLGLSRKLLEEAEQFARENGFSQVKLSVRSNREAAISLYESCGYKKWGVLKNYEKVANKMFSGFFYVKDF